MFVASTKENMKGIPFKARSLSIKTHLKKSDQENSSTEFHQCDSPIATMSNGFHKYDSPISPFPKSIFPELLQCDSPALEYPCTGCCRCLSGHVLEEDKADVVSDIYKILQFLRLLFEISLGSCKDDQLSWDDESNLGSMSQALVEILSMSAVHFSPRL